MHSRDKGTSGSTKPSKLTKPSWVRYKPKEIELIISKLAKEGKTTAEIGIIMRDSYGIPSVREVTGKKITAILAEKNLTGDLPEDLKNLIRRAVKIRKHLEENKQDNTAKRGLQLTESKVKRLVNYYKANGRLASDWKYDPENVRLYL